jgi:hypothetical protein
MVRTIQTTHVNTNYIPPSRQALVYPVVVEAVLVDLHHLCGENGDILEDSSEEILATPTLLSESQAFIARASSLAPPAPVAQVPAPRGDDTDGSSDGEDDDDEAEEKKQQRRSQR